MRPVPPGCHANRLAAQLDTAQALIQRDGLLSLQMSRLAEACEYATGTLYRHFASKEDLLVALATRNSLQRIGLFERAARWSGPTRDRILALALADLIVLREQPEHFRLAHAQQLRHVSGLQHLVGGRGVRLLHQPLQPLDQFGQLRQRMQELV